MINKSFYSVMVVILLFAVTCSSAQAPAAPKRISIGVMPVFDATGEDYGDLVTQHMTQMLFEDLQDTQMQPVLLNPGGAYTPLDVDLIKEFAQMSGVDAVVITIFQMPLKPRTGSYTLKVDAQVMDAKTGKLSPTQNYTERINRLEAAVETSHPGGFFGTGASRKFDKQPLGKKSSSFAKQVTQLVSSTVPGMVTVGTAEPPPVSKTTCQVDFHVAYPDKRAISKSYGLTINGKEESLWTKEGIASVNMPSGPAIVVVTVADAPYRLPVQRVYAANTFADCDKKERTLALEIGPAGEAFLRWR